MQLQGKARLGKKTKDLVKVLQPREIAIIDHQDLDAMGAQGLVDAGVTLVLNAADSITGRYPNLGPKILLDHNVPVVDKVGSEIFNRVNDGDLLEVISGQIYLNAGCIAQGRLLDQEIVAQITQRAKDNLNLEISKFVDNTMEYMQKEKALLLTDIQIPKIKTNMQDRHVVIVVRGMSYREDLATIRSYIDEINPVLIGVDGGADALIEFGRYPDIVIGDMDSITDNALKSGAEIIVHAYQDRSCPAAARLDDLKLDYQIMPAPGTSEDIALLLAYELDAQLIVAVGLHSHLIDFLEKGRPGMASTFLVRMKVGALLVDAKGVSRLYTSKSRYSMAPLMIAAIIPIIYFISLPTPWRQFVRLLWLQIRLFVGGL